MYVYVANIFWKDPNALKLLFTMRTQLQYTHASHSVMFLFEAHLWNPEAVYFTGVCSPMGPYEVLSVLWDSYERAMGAAELYTTRLLWVPTTT